MRRCLALLLVLVAVAHATVDPCKRQPFRGRCPSVEGAPPKRSQFVLRYYSRNGECVSYPYGHCASDSTEPQLYRYKEECEDACITPPPANLGSPKDGFDQTYGTVSPSKESTKVEEAPTKTFTITADVSTTTETPTTTETLTTSEASTTTEAPSTIEVTTTTEAPTTTEVKTTVEVKTTAEPTTTTAAPTTVEITTTSEVTTTESPTTLSTTQSTVSITTEATETSDATEKATENLQKAEVTTESSESTSESSTTVEATTVTSTTTTTTTKAPVIEKTVERKIEKISVLQRGETVTPTTSFEEVLPTTAVPRTDCERRRAAAASSKIRGGFVPVCKGNGDFEPLQCELDGRQCFCVDQSGIEIANSRTHNGVKPDCAKIEAAVRPRVQECTGEFERGPCASHMERWHYVEAEQKCKQFSYSGCGGNGNNYETERDCIGRCAPLNAAPRCAKGEPLESKQGSFINCAKTECPSGYKCNVGQQISVCCPDTEKTVGLQQSTTVGDVCRLDKERGPCDKYELRFYFNGETKECKYFFWGGCEGNGNNFETIESCESTCGITKNRGTTRHPTPRTTQGFRINQNNERTESTAPAVTTSTPTPTTHHHVETTTTARPTTRTTRRPTTTPANIPPVQTADDDDVVVSNRNNNFQGHPVAPVSPAVLLEGSDLSDAAADANRCAHPRDSGTCGGQFVRWFWDDDRKTCDVFTYSGCQGNGNNFASREECFAICHKENAPDFANVCHHDVDAGECNGVFQRFAFDSESGECRPFTYGGCGGNGNNFATITECRSRCQAAVRKPLVVATNLCDHNIDVGECTGVFVRFGFDRESNDCRQFTYGGCGGNGNNFASLLECRNVCVKKACPQVTATCDMSRCQIVEDQNGCPFCSCSPVKQPLPPVPSHCTQVNENSCHEPCLLINNRRGCQECVCPKTTQATNAPQPPPTQMTQQPIFGNPPGHQTGRAPGSDVSVGPPASATRIAPPSPNSIVRAHDVKTVSSQQKTSELESSRPFIPPTLNAELNEKCLQAVEVGPCKNFVDRWFFSSDDGSCRPFKYGGCAGNRNHFFTQKECEIHCARFLQQPDDFSSEEGVDFDSDVLQSVNRRRPIAAGVSQHHEPVPLPVDNYKSPDPVLRGNQPSPYGKKEKVALPVLQGSTLESMAPGQSVSNHPNIITTQGYKITSTTTASSTAPITTTTPSTTRASTTTTTSVPSTESARTQSPSSTSASVSISSSTSPVTADVTTTTSTTTEAPAKTVSVSTTTTTTTTQAPTTTTEIHKVQLPADKEILESSKFSNEKVLKVVDEEQTFLETAVHADEKNDEHKSALKKIEIGMKHRSSFTSTTALPKATQPTEQPQLNESNVKNVLQADAVVTSEPSTVAVTTTSPVTTRAARLSSTTSGTTASESSSSSTTTEAPTSTVSLSSSTSTSSSPSSTTVQSTSTAAPTTTQSDTSTDSDEIAAPSAIPVSAAGVSQFEPVHEEDVLNPNLGLGREPIPTGPVGIGRNLEPLDLDGLEEPTTVLPSSKKPVAFTVAAPPAPAQLNPNVHNLRSEDFDAKVICALAPETGPCTNYLQRWFFNAQSLQCEQFSFGSCGGNQNNFGDRTTCELKCMIALGSVTSQVPERCSYDKDAGFGQGYNVKWYFNMKNLRCEQFVYEGQGGNSNQFETLSDCERFCTPQPKISTAGKVAALPSTTTTTTTAAPSTTEATSVATTTVEITTTTEAAEKKLPVEKDLLPVAPASHSLRPLPEEPLNVSIDESDNIESIDNNDDYDSSEDDENDLLPVPTKITTQPTPPAGLPEFTKTDEVKAPAHAAKTVTQEEVEAEKLVEKKDKNYKAEPIAVQPEETAQENLPRVGPSPPMKVDYQTGQINPVISGIKTFPEGRIPVDKTEFDATSEASQNLPSCPNGLQEMRYADGRPVMCLPGKNQCPDKSVCYFNGIDFFCCPNIDDPYDKHVFGGYDGEETKHGYKIFGPLRVRRLMDEVPLRTKRQTSIDKAFNTAPVSFSIDSVIAPLRFDAEKPRSISRAARMRKPSPPQHGNPMCMLPLAKGDCQEAHLRYYYDRESDSCRLFHYSGCQGNANNFGSLEDCQRLCVLSGQPLVRNTPAPVAKEETSLAPVGQCPVGSPLGGNAPVLCGSSTDSIGCPDGYYCRAGPPDVCCPGPNPTETKKEIRFSPETPKAHNPRGFLNEVLHSTPIFMCPDASDPLMAENGKPRVCGSGFDGMQMCPKGYYCAIDNESGSRLCCSLLGNAERIPNQQVNAPYFGRRSSNPGEIIERGTLPSDSEKPSTVPAVDFSAIDAVADNTKSSISIDASEEEYEDEDETPEHLLLKPLSRHEKLQQSAAAESPKASNIESEVVNIDMPTESPTMVEEVSIPKFNPMDQSICHVKPTEGRACREDEKAPKTNLQYFYSAKDNRCKLYFYRGCGGNENRFERKADCEALCVGKL